LKLAIVTDAWSPQVNGVVTTLQRTAQCLEALSHAVTVFSPLEHRTIACPTYPEIRLALWPQRRLAAGLDALEPDAIHIATEQLRRDLAARGFANVVLWSRGVDTELFRPLGGEYLGLPRPVLAYAGRVAVEKNLDAFLGLGVQGTKIVIGDGPDRALLARRYPDARFLGYRFGADLVRCLSSADVFVFSSRTDTFGLVMLEAMACGTPVAAFPVAGPIDVVEPGVTGMLDEDLGAAVLAALTLDRERCRRAAQRWTWERASADFLSHLARARDGARLSSAA
jgi:glycosyltransferase involved in cell wall biosynthesis